MRDDPVNGIEKVARLVGHPLVGRFAVRILRLLGLDIPRTVVGVSTIRLPHGSSGLVVHPDTVLGTSVTLMQGVTIGRSDQYLDRSQLQPGGGVVIEDDAYIGAGAVVLFRSGQTLTIGKGSLIGANAVVTTSVPPGQIWAGIPARMIRKVPEGSEKRVQRRAESQGRGESQG